MEGRLSELEHRRVDVDVFGSPRAPEVEISSAAGIRGSTYACLHDKAKPRPKWRAWRWGSRGGESPSLGIEVGVPATAEPICFAGRFISLQSELAGLSRRHIRQSIQGLVTDGYCI